MRRLLPILFIALLIFPLAACGGSDKNAKYAAELNEEVTQGFGKAIETLATDPSPDHTQRAVTDLNKLATNIAAIKAPNDKTHQDALRLGAALRSYAQTVQKFMKDESLTTQSFEQRTKLASQSINSIIADINGDLS